ncbi:MAG: CHAT domain-containing protein [Planctomycetota bacterium]
MLALRFAMLAVLFLACQSTGLEPTRVLRPGESVHARLDRPAGTDPASACHVFEIEASELLETSLSLSSDEFDPTLRLIRPGCPAEDVGGGGLLEDAWTTITVRPGERVRVEVRSADARQGAYVLGASCDRAPPPSRPDALRISASRSRRIAEGARASGEHARAAAWFGRGGRFLARSGPFAESRESFREMLASARAASEEGTALEARAHIASLDLLLGDDGAGIEELERLEAETRAKEHRELRVFVLENLGRSCSARGDIEDAFRWHAEELEIARALGSKAAECQALCQLARIQCENGDAERAAATLEAASAAAAATDDPARRAEVECQRALAARMGGNVRQAVEHLRRALALASEDLLRVEILGALGDALVSLQEPLDARRCFEDSWRLARQLGVRTSYPEHLLSYANLEMSMGENDLAIELLETARTAWEGEVLELRRVESLLSLVQARLTRRSKADQAAAPREIAEILEIGERHDDLRLRVDGSILACWVDGRETQATEDARRRLDALLLRASSEGDPALHARAVAMAAWDDGTRGRFGPSMQAAEAALETFQALGEHEQCLMALETIARAASRSRDVDALESALGRALALLGRDALRAGDARELAGLRSPFATFEAYAHDLVTLRLAAPGLAETEQERWKALGFATAGSWKARSLIETLIRRRRHPAPAEAESLREARAAHARAREILEELAWTRAPRAELDEAYRTVREAHSVLEDAEDRAWALANAQTPDLEPRGLPPERVQAALPDDTTALIEFVAGSRELHAYVLTRRRFERVDLGARGPIEADAARFAGVVAGEPLAGRGAEGWGFDVLVPLARKLHASLLDPVLARLEPGVQSLVLVPTTELAGLPFDALVGPPQAGESAIPAPRELPFLVRRFTVDSLPSAPVLADMATSRVPPARPSILVFADPVYAIDSRAPEVADARNAGLGERAAGRRHDLERLDQSRDEAAAIASLVASWAQPPRGEDAIAILEIERAVRDHYRSIDGFELCLGSSATCRRFEELAPKYPVLHVAAHALSQGTALGDPVLVLSSEEDRGGDLTCERILGLQLDADLVVLAACDSAAGKRIDGDGVRSLARSFLHAGARAVVASLWKVRDIQGRELMKSFYTHYLDEGLTPRAALREAKLRFLRGGAVRSAGIGVSGPPAAGRLSDLSDPFYWAGFVYCGPPR